MFAPSPRNATFLLGLILLLALGLRLYRVGTYGIYFDEKSTLLISQGIVLEGYNQRDVFEKKYFTPAEFWKPKTLDDFVAANARGDIGSPFYFGIVWSWLKLFGLSDVSLRMPSVLFGTLTVLLLFGFTKRFFGGRLALLSAFLAAVEPFFVAYSHIARTYSLTFFMTLLATYLFVLIMERERPDSTSRQPGPPVHLYVAYSLTFALCILSHYLTVTVFLCHALYAALFVRRLRPWLSLGAAALAGLALVSPWFMYGSGQYHFQTMAYQARFYRNIALTNPTGSPFGTILPATLPNIARRAVPIFADLFIVTNGLGSALLGLRNTALALALGAGTTYVMHRYRNRANPPVWVRAAVPGLLLAGLVLYSVAPGRFLVLSAAVPFAYLMVQALLGGRDATQRSLVVLLLLLAFVPTLFLLASAWRSGHTFGITQRYSGFSFPYAIILVAMGLAQLMQQRPWFRWPLLGVLAVQAGFIVQLLYGIYADREPKYTYFDKPRIANPYWTAAKQLEKLYQPGDTILYPNKNRPIYNEKMDRTYSSVALLDAQLVNVYLPKDARYVQRIDPAERDKIVLVRGRTGEKLLIFDLKGNTYRYGE